MDRNGGEKQEIVTNSSEICPLIPGPCQYIGDSSMKTEASPFLITKASNFRSGD